MELQLKQEKDLRELFEVESGAFASGLYATVKRARSRRTGQLFAAKHSPKRKENYNEIKLLSRLSNPYIITFKDAFETANQVVVIMEFAPGGDLQSLIDADVVLHESHACKFIYQLLRGLEYMHNKSIAHLDIKPQNLLLMGDFPQTDSTIKICDFELSRVIHPNIEEREIVGTPDYVAPEILQYEPLSLKADIWSTGIVAYVLLTGFSPFGGETDTETFNNIIHNEIDFPAELFDEAVSQSGIEFIGWLCQQGVSARPTASTALQNVWLKSSRLCNRNRMKGMSKSTYDLTKGRERFGERTRLRKSKSREQLWRSKIHLSLSSEKIERWASIAAFPHATANLNTQIAVSNEAEAEGNKSNLRVQSEESLMTLTLPNANSPQVDPTDFSNSVSSGQSYIVSNGTCTNGNSSNKGKHESRLLQQKREMLKPVACPSEEFTHGDKIKETVGDDEVQQSVAELISRFGGAHNKNNVSKCHSSTSIVNLDPIEEADDQEAEMLETNNNHSDREVNSNGNYGNDTECQRSKKSTESNSTASNGSSRSSVDDIKQALAQLLPLNLNAASKPTPENWAEKKEVQMTLRENNSRNNSQDLISTRKSSNNDILPVNGGICLTAEPNGLDTGQIQHKSNATPPAPKTVTSVTSNALQSQSQQSKTLNSKKLTSTSVKPTQATHSLKTNRYASRYERKIDEKTSPSLVEVPKSCVRARTSSVLCSGSVGKARRKLAK